MKYSEHKVRATEDTHCEDNKNEQGKTMYETFMPDTDHTVKENCVRENSKKIKIFVRSLNLARIITNKLASVVP